MATHILKFENKILQGILQKVNDLKQLHQLLAEHLEPEMAKHCRVVNYDKNCLIVFVDNGNWATQLRFRIPDLMAALKQYPLLQNLSGIIYKTRPPYIR